MSMTEIAYRMNKLTMTQALMIIRNPESGYDRATIKRAAVFVLGSFGVSEEDASQASSLL